MFTDIKGLLKNSIRKAGIVRQVEANRVVDFINKFIETDYPRFSGKIRALYIMNKSLTISSSSSIISQEFKFLEKEIIEKINGNFRSEVVSRVRYMS